MSNIGNLGVGNQDILENWIYATAAARTSATGFTAADVGKIAYQEDNGTYWRLTAVTPTWAQIGGGGVGDLQVVFDIGAEAGDVIIVNVELQDSSGNYVDDTGYALHMFLSDDSGSLAFTAAAPNSISAAYGGLGEIVTSVYMLAFFDYELFQLSISETGTGTWYLCVLLPDGTTAVSGAITFA